MTDTTQAKTRRIAFDMLINIGGTALPLVLLQLVIYPLMARRMPDDLYGMMQTSMSLVYLIGSVLGDGLSTTRLLRNNDYLTESVVGDFNILNYSCICGTILISFIVFPLYFKANDFFEIILLVLICLINYLICYLEVSFRLELNYKRIFIDKVITCIGYIVGFALFLFSPRWEWVFLVSYVLRLFYYLGFTSLLREQLIKTTQFGKTLRSFISLAFAGLLNKSLTYFDKLLLYPLLGGTAVSVYFAANIFGKLMLQVLNPITNVMLSYIAKSKGVKKNIWIITISVGGSFCLLMYVICIIISEPVLKIFYPQWVDAAIPLVPIATASLCVSSFYSIVHPLFLKYLDPTAQIAINGVSLLLYIALSLCSYKEQGIMGCCVALFLSYVVRLIIAGFFCLYKARHSVKA